MTIERGAPWGSPASGPPDEVADDDAELAALALARCDEEQPPRLGIRSGDVLRELGLDQPGAAAAGREPMALPFDLGLVTVDGGGTTPFVAHVVARRRFWAGELATVMNVGWCGPWYLGPRAHPNDGLLDVVSGQLPLRQRLEARRRVTSGSHLPHPALTSRRVRSWEHHFERPVGVAADGVSLGVSGWLSVQIRPDAFILIA